MLKVQSGEPVTAPDFKVVQASNFAAKVSDVVAVLEVSCSHRRYADTTYVRSWHATKTNEMSRETSSSVAAP